MRRYSRCADSRTSPPGPSFTFSHRGSSRLGSRRPRLQYFSPAFSAKLFTASCSSALSFSGSVTWASTYMSPRRPFFSMPRPEILNFCPCWVPAGMRSTTRLSSNVLTLIREPRSACARLIGMTPIRSSPSRRKKRSGAMWIWTMRSPRPLGPWFLTRMRAPSSTPAGMSTLIRFSTRTSPPPWQVGQRCEGTVPLPRHTGQGRFTANPPCPNDTVPRPLHSGQVLIVAPFAAPLPPHLGHRQRDRHGAAERRDAKRNGDLRLGVFGLGFASGASPATKDRREDVAEAAKIGDIEVAAVLGRGTPTAAALGAERAVAAHLIVFLPLVSVAEHVVRFVDLLEALGGLRMVGTAVGMVLLGQPPEGLLDFVRRGGLGDSQHLIVVALCCHYWPCQVSTTTRAGRNNVSRIL